MIKKTGNITCTHWVPAFGILKKAGLPGPREEPPKLCRLNTNIQNNNTGLDIYQNQGNIYGYINKLSKLKLIRISKGFNKPSSLLVYMNLKDTRSKSGQVGRGIA